MKYRSSISSKGVDIDPQADDSIKNSGKMYGETSSMDSSSYDTTENLTDTDSSGQIKMYSPPGRGTNSSSGNNRQNAAESGVSLHSNDIELEDVADRLRFVLDPIEVHEVESHHNFTSKERGKYWWSDREKDRIMAKHERVVAKYEQQKSGARSVSSKKSGKSSSLNYRGLESWTAAGALKLDYTIEQCITAVMDEQDRQWQENADDDEIIAQLSLAVTEDSARRARLNGLQDAQEALKVRSETWGKTGSDEMSVGSAISTGTAALVKKKKRSKLLARLDDSSKLKKQSDDGNNEEEPLASTKKSTSTKAKKKKKKSSKKKEDHVSVAKKVKKKSSKEKTTSVKKSVPVVQEKGTKAHTKESSDVIDDHTSVATALVSSFMAGPEIPVSPLSTHIYSVQPSTVSNECPLLATLRRQQEQLRKETRGLNNDRNTRPLNHLRHHEENENDCSEDVSPLLQTLRRQQKKQASSWQKEKQDDPSCGGNIRNSSHGNGAVQKSSGTREDHSSKGGDSESADSSDPPGRRPRRIASHHSSSIPEGSSTMTNRRTKSRERGRSKSRERPRTQQLVSSNPPPQSSATATPSPVTMQSSGSGNPANSPGSKRTLKSLRSGAKTLFKRSPKSS
mmetsp:Transcript_26247/g.57499  ORF Transcript_26247/g.57499 Transcript_26247/m.57499 type:complete len:623 (-) Transcript_26247:341-2209(-)|eukprot:CAMPEP_0168180810 /NCGR_PEP_ID=MMETSP0139_2-20121125/10786_1 /TAXON_ID=44445 /ORGANISM="Pseudo-nitzschia australis, Strain 10249 10 AB" /LENGTH=622 /DNA_ID=CAMNT_0008101153 /DNA_START=250 /DNA_END=2118 /DNA_ORIENTATION=+